LPRNVDYRNVLNCRQTPKCAGITRQTQQYTRTRFRKVALLTIIGNIVRLKYHIAGMSIASPTSVLVGVMEKYEQTRRKFAAKDAGRRTYRAHGAD
jgi:hypothetical protein